MISGGEATGIGPQNGRTPAVGPGLRTEVGVVSDPLSALLTASHLLAPDQLADTVAAHARDLGARETVLYLVDYQQLNLLPLPGAGVPQRQELPIEGTLAGRAFRRLDAVAHSAADGRHHLWVPLLDGVERLGVAELVFAAEPSADLRDQLLAYVTLAAELLVVNGAYTDLFARLRRRKTLSLAAEIQWELLPPLTFGTDRLVITGGLEPAYEIGGDSFDYAVNPGTADLLVLDSVGHGLPAAVLAAVAVGAYRHARRNAVDLPDIAAEVNAAIAVQFGHSQFATAVLARLDVDTGRLRWINAGHPQPLIVRGSSVVHPPHCPPARPLGLQEGGPPRPLTVGASSVVPPPHCPPARPLGLQEGRPLCCETRLEPGDRLLLYTDGIVEARSPDGEFFGERRLADFVKAAVADGEPAPETVRRLLRRLLAHQADQLQDDASIVVLEWHTGHARQLQP